MFGSQQENINRFPLHEINSLWFDFLLSREVVTISGIELVAMADEVIQEVIKERRVDPKDAIISKGAHWLGTAGYLDKFISNPNVSRTDNWFPKTFTVYSSRVAVKNINGGPFVQFNEGGDYVSITKKLSEIPGVEQDVEFIDFVKEFCGMLSGSEQAALHLNQTHSELAKALLMRVSGSEYPEKFAASSKFLDTLLMLVIGVEGSRNNVSFLTWIVMLDLMSGNHTYGKSARAFSWFNAFSSPAGYKWNDYESKDRGGKFSMATNSTGPGNLSKRGEFIKHVRAGYGNTIKNNMQEILSKPQHHRVVRREISLLVKWLTILRDNRPENFQGINNRVELISRIKELFKQRFENAYLAEQPSQNYLPENQGGFLHSVPLQRHFEHDKFVYELRHLVVGQPKNWRRDSHYHRVDSPCKLTAEYIRDGREKRFYSKVFGGYVNAKAQVNIYSKQQVAIIRELRSDLKVASLTEGVIFDWPQIHIKISGSQVKLNDEVAERYFRLFAAFSKWQLNYFNGEKFIESLYFDGFYKKMRSRSASSKTIHYIVRNLKWTVGCEDTATLDKEQIESLLRRVASEKELANINIPAFVNDFLRALHFSIDPVMENGVRFMANDSICMPSPQDCADQLMMLSVMYKIPDDEAWYIIREYFALSSSPFSYRAGFRLNKQLTPCPHCYKLDNNLNMGEKKAPYDAVLCFMGEDQQFHLVGSKCHEEGSYVEGFFVSKARLEQKSACGECWDLQALAQDVLAFSPEKKRRRLDGETQEEVKQKGSPDSPYFRDDLTQQMEMNVALTRSELESQSTILTPIPMEEDDDDELFDRVSLSEDEDSSISSLML